MAFSLLKNIQKLGFIFFLILISCSPNQLKQMSTASDPYSSWAEETLSQLTLREKIAQMLVYRMNMIEKMFHHKSGMK